MGATHHLHPNVRFLQLQSSDEKSTVRSDRKSLIKLKRLTVWLAFFIIVFRLVRDVVANHKTTRYAGAATKVIQKNHLA